MKNEKKRETDKVVIKMNFDPNIAKAIGVEEAIMFSNIEFWVEKNKSNNKQFKNGRYWTYNSLNAFSELFPFWTKKQIRRILNNLKEKGYIETSIFNKYKYDRTFWYTVNDFDELNPPNSKNSSVINQEKPKKTTTKKIKPNKNITKKTIEEKLLADEATDHEVISEIIFKFQKINPMIKYMNKTERSAASEIIEKLGKQDALKITDFAISVQGQSYAPTITTPFELSKKIGKLKVFYDRQKNQEEDNSFISKDGTWEEIGRAMGLSEKDISESMGKTLKIA